MSDEMIEDVDLTQPQKMEHLSIESSSSSSSADSNIIEDILEKIGVGKYHYINYLVVGIAWLTDGAEVLAMALLNYVVVYVIWFESIEDAGLLGFFIFAGFFIGSLCAGVISDKYGRKKPFLIYTLFLFLTGVASALSPNYSVLLGTRFLFGITVGLITPSSSSIIVEITSKKQRGAFFILIGSLFSFGELIAILIGWSLKVEKPGNDSWRALVVWTSVPGLLSCILGYFYMEESPRYALQKNANDGIKVLEKMFYVNHGYELKLTEYERDKIHEWTQLHQSQEQRSPIAELFKGANLKITLLLWVIWWVLSFVYYGIVYVLPLVLSRLNNTNNTSSQEIDYYDLTTAVLAEIPGYIAAIIAVEKQKFGRKRSSVISFAICGISCMGAYILPNSFFMIFIYISKFFANAAFELMSPYTSELYPTNCRATGFGFASAASRIGGMMMPVIIVSSFETSPTFPFLIFGFASLIASIACSFLPYDTTGVALDERKHN